MAAGGRKPALPNLNRKGIDENDVETVGNVLAGKWRY